MEALPRPWLCCPAAPPSMPVTAPALHSSISVGPASPASSVARSRSARSKKSRRLGHRRSMLTLHPLHQIGETRIRAELIESWIQVIPNQRTFFSIGPGQPTQCLIYFLQGGVDDGYAGGG